VVLFSYTEYDIAKCSKSLPSYQLSHVHDRSDRLVHVVGFLFAEAEDSASKDDILKPPHYTIIKHHIPESLMSEFKILVVINRGNLNRKYSIAENKPTFQNSLTKNMAK
jgi:hypothetical protein